MNKFFTFLFIFLLFSCSESSEEKPKDSAQNTPQKAQFQQFTEILTQESGLDFSNTILETQRDNVINFEYLYNGGGVAIGDINNDSLPDIYFSATTSSNKLFLNKGNLKFEDITEKSNTGSKEGFSTGVNMIDINNDGWLDIYVCRTDKFDPNGRINLLYINNGDLTFTESAKEYGLDLGSYTNQANFFDYDLDGDLDVYFVNHPVDFKEADRVPLRQVGNQIIRAEITNNQFSTDKFFKNIGNKYIDYTAQVGINNKAFGLSSSVADFNEDGYPDIYVANDYTEPDFLFINQKNGKFKEDLASYIRHTSHFGMGSDIADFNNDGHEDVVVLDMLPEDNRRQKKLASVMNYKRYQMQVKYGFHHQQMRNTLQLNNGNNSFSEIGQLAGISCTDWSWGPILADFDNDGWKDLFISNGYRKDMSDLDYIKFTLDSLQRLPNANELQIDDITKLIPSEKVRNYMYKNGKNLTFQDVSNQWGFSKKTFSNGVAYADLDLDGDLDLVINNIDENAMLYRNNSEKGENNYIQFYFNGSEKNKEGIGATVKLKYGNEIQINTTSSAKGFLSCSENLLHFGLGNQEIIETIEVIWQDGKSQILENVKANQKIYLDYKNASNPKKLEKENLKTLFTKSKILYKHQENEFNDFDREILLPHQLSRLGPKIAIGDVNGDNLEDFFICGAARQAGEIFIQNKNSNFKKSNQTALLQDKNHEDINALFFDADGDGDLDLYVVSGGNVFPENSLGLQDRLYLNAGNGTFSKTKNVLPKMITSGSCVISADIDSDSDLDLFVGGRVIPGKYPISPSSYLLRNDLIKPTGKKGSLSFTNITPVSLQNVGMVSDAVFTDLNADKKPDLMLCGEWMPISIFINQAGNFENQTQKYGLSKSNGWWNSLTPADLDNDGDLDFIAGNFGTNTRLKATQNQPLELYFSDFDGNGTVDPIICYYNFGQSWPFPTLDKMQVQMPSLRKRFVRYTPYTKASIQNLFPQKINQAQKLSVYNFQNSVLINQGGSFYLKALPIEAQISPIYGAIAEDFDSDGKKDLLLAGNNFTSEVEIGRYDAGNGLFLKGNSNGSFQAIHLSKSGFYAPKDARDLKLIHLANGKKLILVANNDDNLLVFEIE